ncbi:hypothetical protein HYQ45_015073 [Verticillium longisporum]|uniref:Uncharacterized protein n=1 Tax=Verticillium longisporum TaxID=100787 RepID=A0A8I2Z734_VERLO|nr:hypothetical protein HYQ45_015073 [Verticillium longisporum]KAG7126051.1 hypothetical protein HYQ44_001091 [Verticillium longisporum]KAG7148032.1 hypothetical protein HYQ46_003116 [Verticillium longisporum]
MLSEAPETQAPAQNHDHPAEDHPTGDSTANGDHDGRIDARLTHLECRVRILARLLEKQITSQAKASYEMAEPFQMQARTSGFKKQEHE